MRAWIETAQENGQSIPEPQMLDDYSGKFVVRLPKTLHRQLVDRAAREGVSLNALVSVALGQYVGMEAISKLAQPVR
jgi:antitoxin HicB